MYKVAVLGDWDSIYGFATVGLETFPMTDSTECVSLIRRLVADDYAVIYLTEILYEAVAEQLEETFSGLPLPAIIPIPGIVGNTGIGMKRVKKSVERAIGTDIIFGED